MRTKPKPALIAGCICSALGGVILLTALLLVLLEHRDPLNSCNETFDVSMNDSIVALEVPEIGRTLLPLGGYYCDYETWEGGVYRSTTSWTNTVFVGIGFMLVLTGGFTIISFGLRK